LILAFRTESGGVLHEGHTCAEDQWKGGGGGGGGVLGWLARFLFLPPHRLPKSQQKYIGGTSLVIGQQMRVTNQGKKGGAKSRNGRFIKSDKLVLNPFIRCPNVYVYVCVDIFSRFLLTPKKPSSSPIRSCGKKI
jgi:hypothetical protein